MPRYLIRRLLESLAILLTTTVLVFLLIGQIPGSPWSRKGGALFNVPENSEGMRVLNYRYGLDQPLWRQIMRYVAGDIDPQGQFICGLICLNLGPSLMQTGRLNQDILFSPPPDQGFLSSAFGYSLRLALLALLMAAGMGVPLGIVAAAREGSLLDRAVSIFTALILSVPTFVVGLLLLLVLAGWLHLIKFVTNWTDPRDWIIPGLILSLPLLGSTARLTRTSMLDALHGDYVRTARGKGLHEIVVFGVHVFRNALVPVLAYLGPAAVELFATSIVVEYMFGFPGMGREFIESLVWLDYPMVISITVVYSAMIAIIGLVMDILRSVADPRLRIA
jgi:oligopeptide transport system permease protein